MTLSPPLPYRFKRFRMELHDIKQSLRSTGRASGIPLPPLQRSKWDP